ncbi:MAG: hypothetical protein H6739_35030 [Alphaproteobacteria bacterium]|nr:hypothetical protein [Alphaproteobacteria bacterium]
MSDVNFPATAQLLNVLAQMEGGLEMGLKVLDVPGVPNVGPTKLTAIFNRIRTTGPVETPADIMEAEGVGEILTTRIGEALNARGVVTAEGLSPAFVEGLKRGDLSFMATAEVPASQAPGRAARVLDALVRRAAGPEQLALASLLRTAIRLGAGAPLDPVDRVLGQVLRSSAAAEDVFAGFAEALPANPAAAALVDRHNLSGDRPSTLALAFARPRLAARLQDEVEPAPLFQDTSPPVFTDSLIDKVKGGDLGAAKELIERVSKGDLSGVLQGVGPDQIKELVEKAVSTINKKDKDSATPQPTTKRTTVIERTDGTKVTETEERTGTPEKNNDEDGRPTRAPPERIPEGDLYRISVHTVTCREVQGRFINALSNDEISYVIDGDVKFNQANPTVPLKFASGLHENVNTGETLSTISDLIPDGKSDTHIFTENETVLVAKQPVLGKQKLGQAPLSIANAYFKLDDFKKVTFDMTLLENDSDTIKLVKRAFKLAQGLVDKLAELKPSLPIQLLADTKAIEELGKLIVELLGSDDKIGTWTGVTITNRDVKTITAQSPAGKTDSFVYWVARTSGAKVFKSGGADYRAQIRIERLLVD